MDEIKKYFTEHKNSTFSVEENNSKKRSEIHEYCKNNGLKSLTKTIKESKYIFITDTKFSSDVFDMSEDEIMFFCKYSNTSFPNNMPDYFDYYLELYDVYFDTKKKYGLFKDALSQFKSFYELKEFTSKLSDKIIKEFSENEEFNKIKNNKVVQKTILNNDKKTCYTIDNIGKQFISIDIKSANITVFFDKIKGIYKNKTWKEYLKQHTDIKFLLESKYFREVICGKSKIHTFSKNYYSEYLYNAVHNVLLKNGFVGNDIVCVPSDEIVFNYKDSIDIEKIQNELDLVYPNIFRVEGFKLDKLGNKSTYSKYNYIKEYFYPEKKIEFKCCQKIIMCQIIKKYEKKELKEEDLLFVEPTTKQFAKFFKPYF